MATELKGRRTFISRTAILRYRRAVNKAALSSDVPPAG